MRQVHVEELRVRVQDRDLRPDDMEALESLLNLLAKVRRGGLVRQEDVSVNLTRVEVLAEKPVCTEVVRMLQQGVVEVESWDH